MFIQTEIPHGQVLVIGNEFQSKASDFDENAGYTCLILEAHLFELALSEYYAYGVKTSWKCFRLVHVEF